ncbi:PSP1 domain-containing protein [Polluticaenibacter yanchengensis]|uniref:Regulatory iron-sulfur-containing complex subunit RicT n=1 Tax=Polluticaenibacter yanchengensis TaxID=3014562 RepID=A0ABT4UJB0_9BACT|nr:regulatory iron-sulfur-containing complex subunit RicT [Chitinophagaceae bacterium LY-5]
MACGSCGTGTPNGCKSNGGCSTGSCNRMNVHDWLMNLPFANPEGSCKIVEVSFNQGSRKDFFRNNSLQHYFKGELIAVEGVAGFDVGEVSLSGELVRLQMKKKNVNELNTDLKKILRKATQTDLDKMQENKAREKEVLIRSRAIARQLNLQMKIAEVEIQADGKKATFFYIADDRVDFRELIKVYATEFRVKVEMRQIGARQEAGKVGGIGSCGRELCCSTWLQDFKSVNTNAARYQNLSINQTKLSGQCGRLKCCLNYELDTYLDALQDFPENADFLETTKGRAMLIKKDIFKNLMWYTLPDSNRLYPLTIVRVKEILSLNHRGVKADELQPVELSANKSKELEPEFVDVVGQISLKSLDKSSKRKDKDNKHKANNKNIDRKQQGNRPEAPQSAEKQVSHFDRKKEKQQQNGGQNNNNNQQRIRQRPEPAENRKSRESQPQQQQPVKKIHVQPAEGPKESNPAIDNLASKILASTGSDKKPNNQKPQQQRNPNKGHQKKPPHHRRDEKKDKED